METLQLDPSAIKAEDNIRLSLKAGRLDALKAAIQEYGGIRVPVEVEKLDKKEGKFTHRLKVGFYRHQSALDLKMPLPAIEVEPSEPIKRLRDQISENADRENLSPMDQALAIKKLLDAGVSRMEVRTIFARPGGKKGDVQPASNAWVNIVLSFLDLPKAIQTKIHEGVVGVKAAYQLGKVPADKRQAVLDAALADRARELEGESKDEERYLAAQQKVEAAKAKVAEVESKIDAARVEAEKMGGKVEEARKELAEAKKAPYLEADEAEKKKIQERLSAANNTVKSAEKLAKDAKNALAKLHDEKTKAEEIAAEKAQALDETKKPTRKADKGKGKTTGVSDADIKKAAKDAGTAGAGYTPLNLSEIRIYVKSMSASTHPVVASIGTAIRQAFDGVTTEKEMLHDLGVITGEIVGELTTRTTPAPTKKVAAKK